MDSTTGAGLVEREEVIYPDSDGMPMAENGNTRAGVDQSMGNAEAPLPGQRGNVTWWATSTFMRRKPRPSVVCRAPDLMVVKGVDATYQRRTFLVWEENAVPCVVIEITSKSTAEEDMYPRRNSISPSACANTSSSTCCANTCRNR